MQWQLTSWCQGTCRNRTDAFYAGVSHGGWNSKPMRVLPPWIDAKHSLSSMFCQLWDDGVVDIDALSLFISSIRPGQCSSVLGQTASCLHNLYSHSCLWPFLQTDQVPTVYWSECHLCPWKGRDDASVRSLFLQSGETSRKGNYLAVICEILCTSYCPSQQLWVEGNEKRWTRVSSLIQQTSFIWKATNKCSEEIQ